MLVNGLPLDCVPSNYENHPAYRTLFGDAVLEVTPIAVPGMQFSCKEEYFRHSLYLGLSSEDDLLVQALLGGRTYEFIPNHVLRGGFPTAFVDNFVHWYDSADDSLEFRPKGDPWTSSPDNWRLTRAGPEWQLAKGGVSLVSIMSTAAKALSCVFACLEDPLGIHIVLHHSSSSVEIKLPRIQLGFHLRSGTSSIQSRQFRGMSVDKDQSLGTLVGLCSKLILRNEHNDSRLVLVPEGSVSCTKVDDHVHVTIDKGSAKGSAKRSATMAHAYRVDDQLGRLIDNGTLQGKLFLSYLHALTAFCLPDPLIGRTGTEQALSILGSAAVRSFDQLSANNSKVLANIAQLTPKRVCYPIHERLMQTVKWSGKLDALSQHGAFLQSVECIVSQARRAKIFQPDSSINFPYLDPRTDQYLLERDNIRSSTFRVSGFGAEDHSTADDEVYLARDGGQYSKRGLRAFAASRMIFDRHTDLTYPVPARAGQHLWHVLSEVSQGSQVFGPAKPVPFDLKYDAGLLPHPNELVSKCWIDIHRHLSRSTRPSDRFGLMIWLSTMAFSKQATMPIVQTIASFFTVPQMAEIDIPDLGSSRLDFGADFDKEELHNMLQLTLQPLSSCPEARLSRNFGEPAAVFNQRRDRLYFSNRTRSLGRFLDGLNAQWPCRSPQIPGGSFVTPELSV